MQTFDQFTSSLLEALDLDPNVEYGVNAPEYNDKEFAESTFLSIKTWKTKFVLNDEVYEVKVINHKYKGNTISDIEFGHMSSLKKKVIPFAKKKKQVPSNDFYGRTGVHGALSVFSYVLSVANVKIKEYNPEIVAFSGADAGLDSAYTRILKSKSGRAMADKLGYYPSQYDSGPEILLIRKDVEDIDILAPKGSKKG